MVPDVEGSRYLVATGSVTNLGTMAMCVPTNMPATFVVNGRTRTQATVVGGDASVLEYGEPTVQPLASSDVTFYASISDSVAGSVESVGLEWDLTDFACCGSTPLAVRVRVM